MDWPPSPVILGCQGILCIAAVISAESIATSKQVSVESHCYTIVIYTLSDKNITLNLNVKLIVSTDYILKQKNKPQRSKAQDNNVTVDKKTSLIS